MSVCRRLTIIFLSLSSFAVCAQTLNVVRTQTSSSQKGSSAGSVIPPGSSSSNAAATASASGTASTAPLNRPVAPTVKTGDPFVYYQDKARGWHFKEPIPEPIDYDVEEIPPPPPPSEPPPPEKPASSPSAAVSPKALSAEWIRENMQKYLDAAIDDPTPQNVSNYLYLQKYAMDASERFAMTYRRVSMADPGLDETAAAPVWSAGSTAMQKVAEEGRTNVISGLAKDWGIWFFFRSDCSPCHIQAPVLKAFADKYGFSVLPVSTDGGPLHNSPFGKYQVDRGQAAKLGVTGTPTILLVRPPDVVIPLSYGLSSMPELEQRMIELGNEVGAISAKQYQSTRADRRVLMPPMVNSQATAALDTKSPDAVRDLLKRSISGRQ